MLSCEPYSYDVLYFSGEKKAVKKRKTIYT